MLVPAYVVVTVNGSVKVKLQQTYEKAPWEFAKTFCTKELGLGGTP
jgi:hypothetical protein